LTNEFAALYESGQQNRPMNLEAKRVWPPSIYPRTTDIIARSTRALRTNSHIWRAVLSKVDSIDRNRQLAHQYSRDYEKPARRRGCRESLVCGSTKTGPFCRNRYLDYILSGGQYRAQFRSRKVRVDRGARPGMRSGKMARVSLRTKDGPGTIPAHRVQYQEFLVNEAIVLERRRQLYRHQFRFHSPGDYPLRPGQTEW
jgi:hypothetical protein